MTMEHFIPADPRRRSPSLATRVQRGVIAALVAATSLSAGAASAAEAGEARSQWPSWAIALVREVQSLRTLAEPTEDVWRGLPVVRAHARGIVGDGRTDVTDTLQAALDSLSGGGTLLLERGVYVHSRCLVLRHARTRIVGAHARLHAVDPGRMCIRLEGDHTELRDLEMTATTIGRGLAIEQARVVVRGRGARVVGNRIVGATSAGIWVQGAQNFALVGNHVSATLADGIHNSEGATYGYIARNVTDRTGDDGIAVVSYRSSARSGRILIEDNRVSDVPLARGIALVGAHDVVVRRNHVEGTGRAAGIIVTREDSYDTYGASRIVVVDNVVSKVARAPSSSPVETTGQASIDVNAHVAPTSELQVRQVLISRNVLANGLTDGIRLLGGVCDVTITRNDIRDMKGQAIVVADPACRTVLAHCADNTVEAEHALPPVCRGRE